MDELTLTSFTGDDLSAFLSSSNSPLKCKFMTEVIEEQLGYIHLNTKSDYFLVEHSVTHVSYLLHVSFIKKVFI